MVLESDGKQVHVVTISHWAAADDLHMLRLSAAAQWLMLTTCTRLERGLYGEYAVVLQCHACLIPVPSTVRCYHCHLCYDVMYNKPMSAAATLPSDTRWVSDAARILFFFMGTIYFFNWCSYMFSMKNANKILLYFWYKKKTLQETNEKIFRDLFSGGACRPTAMPRSPCLRCNVNIRWPSSLRLSPRQWSGLGSSPCSIGPYWEMRQTCKWVTNIISEKGESKSSL